MTEDRRWVNRPLVRERDELRVRSLWRMLLGIVVALAPAGAYLLQQNECLKLTYSVNEIHAEQERLVEQEQRLKSRRAALEALPGIERWAALRGGLVRPEPGQLIVMGPAAAGPGNLVALSAQPPSAQTKP